MLVIVSAGDDFSDEKKLFSVMDYLLDYLGITMVLVPRKMGRAADVFPLAEKWAKARRVKIVGEGLSDEELKKAGVGHVAARELHRKLLAKHRPERLIAFPGRGDVDELINQARSAGVKTIEVA